MTTTPSPTPSAAAVQATVDALNTALRAGVTFTIGPNKHIAWNDTTSQWAPAGAVPRDTEFETTWAGGHALVTEYGDCEFHGRCQCGQSFGTVTPNRYRDDVFGSKWEKHVMGLGR